MRSPIKVHRENCSLSRADIALLLDVSPAHVGALERGEHLPTPDQLTTLAGILGIGEHDLQSELLTYRKQLKEQIEVRVTRCR